MSADDLIDITTCADTERKFMRPYAKEVRMRDFGVESISFDRVENGWVVKARGHILPTQTGPGTMTHGEYFHKDWVTATFVDALDIAKCLADGTWPNGAMKTPVRPTPPATETWKVGGG